MVPLVPCVIHVVALALFTSIQLFLRKNEQRHVPGEDKPHRISRTTEPAKMQKAGRGESNTTREQLCDVPSLPNFSWHVVGESDVPTWKFLGTQGKCFNLGTMGSTIAPSKNVLAIMFIRSSGMFHKRILCRILTKSMRKTSLPYGMVLLPW